jgi:serine/threonine protein kinase
MIKHEGFVRFHGLVLKIVRHLATGGMAEVLLCEDVTNKGKFVLKSQLSGPTTVPSYTAFNNDRRFKNFKDEIIAYVQLRHPNIVDFYGFEIVRGVPRILLAYVEGGTLTDWISQGRTNDLRTVLKILIQMATGLQFAHERGLIHRDLKPSNVLMKENTVGGSFISKISDFGIVKVSIDSSVRITTTLELNTKGSPQNGNEITSFISGPAGTRGYGSPEQFHSIPATIDRNSDIFSFGVVAAELLNGGNMPRLYHWRSSGGEIIIVPVSDVGKYIMEFFERHNPSCPSDLVQLIIKCLEIHPDNRWKEEKQTGKFAYFDTILQELKAIYRKLFGGDYQFDDPDMVLNEDLHYIYRANTLKRLGYSEDQTRKLFDKAFSLEPVGFVGWSNRSKLLLDAKRPDEALKAALKAISLNKNSVLAWYNKGNALDELEKYEDANDAFDEAIRIDPTYGLSYYYRAKTLIRLKRYDEALDSFCKALELDEYDIESWYAKENLLWDLEMYESALECLDKIIEIDSNHFNAWYRKGEVQRKLNNLDDAIICFRKVTELEENPYEAWDSIAILLRIKARNILEKTNGRVTLEQYNEILELLNDAKVSCDKAIQIKPTEGLLYYKRAACYIEQTMLQPPNWDRLIEKGLEDLREAIRLDPALKTKIKSEEIFKLISEDQRFKDLLF